MKNTEIESKYAPVTLERFNQIVSELALPPPHIIDMVSLYYDTPTGYFSQNRGTLRYRTENGSPVWAVKVIQHKTEGIAYRQEFEVQCENREQAQAALAEIEGFPQEIVPHLAQATIETVEMRFTRWETTGEIQGVVMAFCQDTGNMYIGGSSGPILEMEIELKQGDPVAFSEIISGIGTRFNLVIDPHSKYHKARTLKAHMG